MFFSTILLASLAAAAPLAVRQTPDCSVAGNCLQVEQLQLTSTTQDDNSHLISLSFTLYNDAPTLYEWDDPRYPSYRSSSCSAQWQQEQGPPSEVSCTSAGFESSIPSWDGSQFSLGAIHRYRDSAVCGQNSGGLVGQITARYSSAQDLTLGGDLSCNEAGSTLSCSQNGPITLPLTSKISSSGDCIDPANPPQ